ncbi:MFS transporter [Micromonospora sp. ATA51]|nr:MFS transporter [Micromonospora sp. ATA51]
MPSWEEHPHHGGGLTGADQAVEERARELVDGAPQVRHLLSADSD